MFKLKIYCNDRDVQYWEDGIGEYDPEELFFVIEGELAYNGIIED